ncbi:PilT/PilU family type 4a pilus ATPase [bacterium]|nr:PilT/PilU family type 4a pilus ATPase [bacterium]
MLEELEKLIKTALEMGAFDVHIKTAAPPFVRIAGKIHRLNYPPISPKELEKLALEMMSKEQLLEFRAQGQVDFSFDFQNLCRLRANIFLQRNTVAISLRLVPSSISSLEKLGFSREFEIELLKIKNGMVLVTGATNSGKTTTIASFVNTIAQNGDKHILVIEDPIEYVYPEYKTSVVNQRQVGMDTLSFHEGLSAGLRQDPDVSIIGELRDQETVETALKAAETGHLVLGTLHTNSAVQTVNRIINIFPSHQRDAIRFILASCLKLVISQMLIPSGDHKSRILAYEILPMLSSVCNLIRQKKVHEIPSLMRIGRKQGCMTMNDTIKELVKSQKIKLSDLPKEYRSKKNE